ncbi:MAG: hypothetical protein MPJ22_06245, partial [Pirellulales bacterium]|nr:hypothetical protein [Pirellulales bacterium]
MGSLTNDFGTSAALSGGGGAVLLTATNQEVPAGGIAIINDTTQFYNVSTSAQMANNTDLSVFTAANNWRPVGDGDTVALTNEVKHNTSHINTIDGELQAITNPTATFAFGTALGGNWGTLEAFYEDATRTLTVTTTDPNGLPNEWENLNRGTILYGFDTGVTPATDGSNNSSFSMEVTSVAFQQVSLRAANDASNTFLTGRGSLSFGIRDYNDTEENTLFGGLRTATITDVVDAIVGSQANGDLIRLGVGTNLSITGGVLNASGTGGSGGDNVDLVGAPVGIDVTLPITADATDLTFNVRISARQAIASGVSYSWGGVALTGGGTSLSEGPQTVTLTLPGAGRATLSADARDTPPVVVIAGTGETYPITTSTPDTDTTYTITTGSSASGAVIELDAVTGTDSTVTILSGTNTTVRESSTGNIEINADVQDSIIGIGGGDGIQIQDDVIIPSGRWEYVTVSSGDSSMAVTFAGTTNFPVPAFMEGIGVSVTAITQMVNATPIDFTFTAQQTSETLLTPAIPSGAANIQPNWASEATAAHVGGDLTLVDFTATNGATIPRVFQDGYRLGADDTVNTGEP